MIDGFIYDDDLALQEAILPSLRALRPHRVRGRAKLRVGLDGDLPEAPEVAWEQISDETFPTALDRPGWPHRADYVLGAFTF